jgi:hypothetical protein
MFLRHVLSVSSMFPSKIQCYDTCNSDITYTLRVLIQACEQIIGNAINPTVVPIKERLSKMYTICLCKNYYTLVPYRYARNFSELTVQQYIIRYGNVDNRYTCLTSIYVHICRCQVVWHTPPPDTIHVIQSLAGRNLFRS